jgi:hypothetical protein
MDIWLNSSSDSDLKEGFEKFGEELVEAKKKYLKAKSFDEEIFGDDYEI